MPPEALGNSSVDVAENSPENPVSTDQRPVHACKRCRSRHQKCDIGPRQKTCSNCEKASATCSGNGQNELRIRFSHVGQKQRRRRNPRRNGASSLQRHDGDSSPSGQPPAEPQQPATGNTPTEPATDASLRSSAWTNTHRAATSPDLGRPELMAASLSSREEADLVGEQPQPSHESYSPGAPDLSFPDQSGPPCFFPLPVEEVKLVKHFFTVLISWFDYCDPNMNFRSYVGSTIANNAAILYGVLAVSARHRTLTMGIEDQNSDEYERRCLEVLIPALNDTTKVLQDTALASAIILRLLEEMTEPPEGQSVRTHNVSAPVLMQIKQGNIQSSGISDAAMIVALRQEIFVANMTKRAVEPIAEYCNIDTSLEPTSDAMWSYRIMAHAARITSFVYGNGSRDVQQWDVLWQYLEDWERLKPDSFRPIYHTSDNLSWPFGDNSQSNGPRHARQKLPEIFYTYECPVAGQQYLQVCRVLLLAHNPRTPVLGLGRANFLRKQEDDIKGAVRIICGICKSNPERQSAVSLAGLAVAMCGEFFIDPGETTELLRLVSEAELHLGWPCLKVSYKLKTFWNLPDFNFDTLRETTGRPAWLEQSH